MSLPPFLLAELRLSFRICAQQHAAFRRCPFSSASALLKKGKKPNPPASPRSRSPHPDQLSLHQRETQKDVAPPTESTKDLIPSQDEKGLVHPERRSEVPMKILPPSEISPEAKLSPMQRLHIEHLTRHPPAKRSPKAYKERLLIYHYGVGKVNWLVFSRMLTIAVAGLVTCIWLPAYYDHGTPWYILGLVWAGSFIPLIFVSWASRPIATEIWLRLPLFARQSPQAAMKYAQNLPRDACIEVRFMRWTGHTAFIPINVVDTVPASSRLKPISFKWIGPRADPGGSLRPNPTAFFVRPASAEGRAVRDTIPGLWGAVYKRLTGMDAQTVPKWKS